MQSRNENLIWKHCLHLYHKQEFSNPADFWGPPAAPPQCCEATFSLRVTSHSSGQQQGEHWQQAQCHPPPAEGGKGRGPVAQVGVAAEVGVVEVEARGVLLSTQPTLGRDGAALLVHCDL